MEDLKPDSPNKATGRKPNREIGQKFLIKRMKSKDMYAKFSLMTQSDVNKGQVSKSILNNNTEIVESDFNGNNRLSISGLSSIVPDQDIERNQNEVEFKSFYVQKDSLTPYSDATSSLHDPEKIKRPMNPFMIFSHYQRKKIHEDHVNLHNAQVAKNLGKKWKELSMEAKLPFKQEAERLRQFHLIEYPGYKYQPRRKIGKESVHSRRNLPFRSQSKMAKNEKCSFKISESFGTNSWANSPVSTLSRGSKQLCIYGKVGSIKVTINSTFKDILRNSHLNKARENSLMNSTTTPTLSYFTPEIFSNLFSSQNISSTPSWYPVANSFSLNPPSNPPNVAQPFHQQQFDDQWYEKDYKEQFHDQWDEPEFIHHVQHQHEDHHLWDQQQWYLQDFTNIRNTRGQLVTDTSYFEDDPLGSSSRVEMNSQPHTEEFRPIDTIPLAQEELLNDTFSLQQEEIRIDIIPLKEEELPTILLTKEVLSTDTTPLTKEVLSTDTTPLKKEELRTDTTPLTKEVLSTDTTPLTKERLRTDTTPLTKEELRTDTTPLTKEELRTDTTPLTKEKPFHISPLASEKFDMHNNNGSAASSSENFLLRKGKLSALSHNNNGSAASSSENTLLKKGNLSTLSHKNNVSAASISENTLLKKGKTSTSSLETILIVANKINVTKTITYRANQLFGTVQGGKKMKGRSPSCLALACLYIACRQEGAPRTFKEMAAGSSVSKKEIIKCFKLILKVHGTKLDLITAADFMPRFCGTLGLAGDIEEAASCISKKAEDLYVVQGRSPRSVAAASIYMASQASGDQRSLKEIGEVAKVNYLTIRQCYKLMLQRAAEIFPSHWSIEIRAS